MFCKFFCLFLFCFIMKSTTSLLEKVAVVTGADRGIGYAIVKGLCEHFDGTVYLTTKNATRGEAALAELKKLNLKPVFHQLDITDKDSVKTFAEFIQEKHGGIDVLINNAGVCFIMRGFKLPAKWKTEKTLSVNYFGLLNVCHALYPLLRPHARVVHLSSHAGCLNRISKESLRKRFLDPNLTEEKVTNLMNEFLEAFKKKTCNEDGWGECPYTVASIGISSLAFVHNRNFVNDTRKDIVVNAVHPGLVNTSMTDWQGYDTTEEGAQAPLFLALLPKYVSVPRGEFVWYNNRTVNWLNPPFRP